MLRNFIGYTGEAGVLAAGAGFNFGAKGQERDLFPSVVGAGPAWIIAVVGGDDHQIIFVQVKGKICQHGVELLQRIGIARYVSPVTEMHIEIDEICEDEVTVFGSSRRLFGRRHQRVMARSWICVANTAPGENIADLANGVYCTARVLNPVKQGWGDGRDGIIMAVCRAGKIGRAITVKGPCNDTSDIERVNQLAGQHA